MPNRTIGSITPLRDKVLVHNIESGAKITMGGIIIPDDDGKERGIRARWAQVYAVGSEVQDIQVGQWILISHGRWSRGVDIQHKGSKTTVRQVDYPEAVLLVADSAP
jgi:co-chaperonin GroES (HSP10)